MIIFDRVRAGGRGVAGGRNSRWGAAWGQIRWVRGS